MSMLSATRQRVRLSSPQLEMMVLEEAFGGLHAYNVTSAFRVTGKLSVPRLRSALHELARAHVALRSRYSRDERGRAWQHVLAAADVRLRIREIRGARTHGRDSMGDILQKEATRRFRISVDPPLRALLLRSPGGTAVVALTAHHLALDGTSLNLLFAELGELYSTGAISRRPRPAQRLNRTVPPRNERSHAHWDRALDGYELAAMPRDLPAGPATFRGRSVPLRISRDLSDRIASLAARSQTSVFTVMLAALGVLVARYTGAEHFIVGVPTSGRDRGSRDAIGSFVRVAPVPVSVEASQKFIDLLRATRTSVRTSVKHSAAPPQAIARLIGPSRHSLRPTVFRVMCNYFEEKPVNFGNLKLRRLDVYPPTARAELGLDIAQRSGALVARLEFGSDSFKLATVRGYAQNYVRVLESVVATPQVTIESIPLGSERIPPHPKPVRLPTTTLHAPVYIQAERRPRAIAIVDDTGARTTYKELVQRADELADNLVTRGFRRGDRAGILLDRSPDMVASILGVLRAGGTYVPLDPQHPPERLRFIARDAGLRVVLTTKQLDRRSSGIEASRLIIDAGPREQPVRPRRNTSWRATTARALDGAYIMYTSGSTGRPKGVLVPHRSACNVVSARNRTHRVRATDRVLHHFDAGFDPSVWQVFGPLWAGAILVLARPGGQRNAAYLCEIVQRQQVSVFDSTPSMLTMLLAQPQFRRAFTSVTRVFCGGEPLPAALLRKVVAAVDCSFTNIYGITETAIDVAACTYRPPLPQGLHDNRVGWPVQNRVVYTVDRRLQPVPAGAIGEIAVGGTSLASGYFGDRRLTRARFVPDPSGSPGSRMYLTGDLGRRLPDGSIVLHGRRDAQVKLRGLRVQLEEVEHTLLSHPSISAAAVALAHSGPRQRLLAFVVARRGRVIEATEILRYLRHRLPSGMLPSAVQQLPELPLSATGKVDRARLARQAVRLPRDVTSTGWTRYERVVARAWGIVLQEEPVSVDADFFESGGDSLAAAQLAVELERHTTKRVSIDLVLQARTPRELARQALASR